MSNDKVQSIMALVVSFGNGRATNAMNHATDGPASDYVNTAAQLQAIESAIRAMAGEYKQIGWTCGHGDCGRIHDEPSAEDGYTSPVYIKL